MRRSGEKWRRGERRRRAKRERSNERSREGDEKRDQERQRQIKREKRKREIKRSREIKREIKRETVTPAALGPPTGGRLRVQHENVQPESEQRDDELWGVAVPLSLSFFSHRTFLFPLSRPILFRRRQRRRQKKRGRVGGRTHIGLPGKG